MRGGAVIPAGLFAAFAPYPASGFQRSCRSDRLETRVCRPSARVSGCGEVYKSQRLAERKRPQRLERLEMRGNARDWLLSGVRGGIVLLRVSRQLRPLAPFGPTPRQKYALFQSVRALRFWRVSSPPFVHSSRSSPLKNQSKQNVDNRRSGDTKYRYRSAV